MSVHTLPTEVLCSVISLLDPIDLISLSQTNQHLRGVIDPQRQHFIERLLALETKIEHGGITPIFRSKDSSLSCHWFDEPWDDMRWACGGCLRLLSHQMFGNHSILRLDTRKPIPGSTAAIPVSSWASSFKKEEPKSHLQQLLNTTEEKLLWVRYIYSIRLIRQGASWIREGPGLEDLKMLQNHGIEGFETMSDQEFEDLCEGHNWEEMNTNATLIERQYCGWKRGLRRCLECRFQRGDFTLRPNGSLGTAEVPIMLCRWYPFANAIDRYFPDFSEALEHKRPPFNVPSLSFSGLSLPITHHGPSISHSELCIGHPEPPTTIPSSEFRSAHTVTIERPEFGTPLWAMYMIRCPGCCQWQEMGAFRLGGNDRDWRPDPVASDSEMNMTWDEKNVTKEFLNNLACNRCFASAFGRESLGRGLLRWLDQLLLPQLCLLSGRLIGDLRETFRRMRDSPPPWADRLAQLWRQNTFLHRERQDYEILSLGEMEAARVLYSRLMFIWPNVQPNPDDSPVALTNKRVLTGKGDPWETLADGCATQHIWLEKCRDELVQNPEALADWALNRKGDEISWRRQDGLPTSRYQLNRVTVQDSVI